MALNNGKCLVTFHCRCPDTQPGDEVCLLGGAPSLGQWQIPCRIHLTTSSSSFPLWTSSPIAIPADIEIKYKYLITQQCRCYTKRSNFGASSPPCSCNSKSCRWECIAGHDDAGNRIVRLSEGSHDLFDKFGQCDLPPLSMGASSICTKRNASNSWAATEDAISSPRRAREFASRTNSGIMGDASVRLNMLKSIESLCKMNAIQVGDLRQTVDRSHSQLLQQIIDPLTGELRETLVDTVATRIGDAAAARAAAAATDAINSAIREASRTVAEQIYNSMAQTAEKVIMERLKQLTTEVVTTSIARASAKLEETVEKLLGRRRCIPGGAASVTSLGTALHSSASTSPSVADRSHALVETRTSDDVRLCAPSSHRRSRSADIETRSSKEKVCFGDTTKDMSIPNDLAGNVMMNTSLSTSDFTDAVLTSKDIGPDLSWIQSMLYDIKRQNVNNRQLLGLVCHNLGMAPHDQIDERDNEHNNTETLQHCNTAFQIFTPPEISRQSSSISLDDDIASGKRRNHIPGQSATNKTSAASEIAIRIGNDNAMLDAECPASPRAVVETTSICMAKSLEKFNVKGRFFPKIYTASGNQDWEEYISTNKGLHKGNA